jgi:hypothetical protein
LCLVLNDHITRITKEEGFSPDVIKNYEADCWQHLQNVWFSAVTSALEDELCDGLDDDLKELPDIYRINLSIQAFF